MASDFGVLLPPGIWQHLLQIEWELTRLARLSFLVMETFWAISAREGDRSWSWVGHNRAWAIKLHTTYLPEKQAPSYMYKSEGNNCWVNKITTSSTCNGLGFWSTGMMRITISDSMLKYPNTSHCGTDTCRRIFSSMSSTVIGFLFVTWRKTKNSVDEVILWKILLLSFITLCHARKCVSAIKLLRSKLYSKC